MAQRRRWSRTRVPVLLLGSLLVPALAGAQQDTEQFRLRGDRVAVHNLVGETRIEPTTGDQVVVEVVRGGADAARLSVETGRRDGAETLSINLPGDRIVYPRLGQGSRSQFRVRDDGSLGGGLFGGRSITVVGSGTGLEAWADLRIQVPAGQQIAVHQGAGRVRVANVNGTLRIDAASARVETDGTRGSLTVDVGSGGVRVHDAEGVVDVDTGSGSVELSAIRASRLRVDTGSGGVRGSGIDVGELDVDVGSGRVQLDGVRMRDGVIDTGSGGVQLGLTGDVRSLDVDTGSGGVTLDVPSGFNADLDVRTGSGGIRVDLPMQVTRQSRNALTARMGEGDARVRIRTGSGGVRLRGA